MANTVDVTSIQYDVELITETGARYILNDALLSLSWEEQEKELSQRAVITAVNFAIGGTWLMALAKINCIIRIYAAYGGERKLVFDGTVWEWQYTSGSERVLTITAYDRLIRLQQSQDFKYYTAGQTTQALIGDICETWGIPFAYLWEESITHEKKIFSGTALSDMIITLLDEVKNQTGKKYIVYFRDGRMQIVGYGANETVYSFANEATISAMNKLTINNLVTRVKILGNSEDEEKTPVEALVDGDTRYGVLQKILKRSSDKTLDAAIADANTILKENGNPEETVSVTVPDLPFLRKGDAVYMSAGNLLGVFYAEGVSHNADERTMTMSLTRSNADDPIFTVSQSNENMTVKTAKGRMIYYNGASGKDMFQPFTSKG